MSLATVGTVSYNGFTFNETTESQVEGRPVYDAAERTVVYVVYTFTIKATITTGPSTYDTGPTLEDIRRRLTTPGAQLTYSGKGFGGLSINVSTVKDVVWGPKPRLLRWKSVGSSAACEIEWACEVAIPECTAARYQFALMEVNFRLQFAIDQSGYTRRVYSGHLRIPQTRAAASARNLSDSADAYREQIVPALAPGFRRLSQDFTLDESKCRLDFSIIDEEMPPTVPPPGVVQVEANHEIQNQHNSFHQWVGTLSASYELARDVPRRQALDFFSALLRERVLQRAGAANVVIPVAFRMSEPEIYGRQGASFSFSYLLTTTLANIVGASGLWTPVGTSNYSLWRTSLANRALHPRGNAQLRFQPSEDVIVDLCAGNVVTLSTGGLQPTLRTLGPLPLSFPKPTPAQSFLHYELRTVLEPEDQVVLHTALPQQQVTLKTGSQLTATLSTDLSQSSGTSSGAARLQADTDSYEVSYTSTGPDEIVQLCKQPTLALTLEGKALRACFLIQPPTLTTVGGLPVTPANREGNGFRSWIIGNLGVPVVAAEWSLRYLLPGVPAGGIGVAPNPIHGG